jgi:hypothetical protein
VSVAIVLATVVTATAVTTSASPALAPAQAVPPFTKNFFGMSMGADLTQLSDVKFDAEMNTMQKMGVHWVRASIPWGLVQHSGPSDNQWILIDRLVETVQAEGMQLIGIIDNPPLWAESGVTPVAGCSLTPPFQLQAYADFAAKVAQRYTSSAVSVLEAENSPNQPGAWPTPDPCAYSKLMKLTYTAIKAADPGILVLNGGVGGTKNTKGSISGSNWIKALYSNGAGSSFDAVSFHPYSYPCTPSDGCGTRTWGALPTVRQTMVTNGDSAKQIWASEFGSPTSGVAGDGHVTEAVQSSIMVDAMQNWVTFPWAGPFCVYEFRDFGTNPTDKSDWFGLVSNDLRHKKPAFFAYQYYATGKGTPPAALASR